VQEDLVPTAGRDPLLPETVLAVDRVFADLYSDADALVAIEAARPALSANPREIKRYVNLFRFYTFIVQRQRLDRIPAAPADSVARLAALAIRWPHLLTALTQNQMRSETTTSVIAKLEEAARAHTDTAWTEALLSAGLAAREEHGSLVLPEWSASLRAFLAQDPMIGALAARLL
jgi:hypothetical protein